MKNKKTNLVSKMVSNASFKLKARPRKALSEKLKERLSGRPNRVLLGYKKSRSGPQRPLRPLPPKPPSKRS
jgi:hypothetical protein